MSCTNAMTIKQSTAKSVNAFLNYSLLTGLCLSLSGCGMFFGDDGVFRNRENDYQKAQTIPPLVLPNGMRSQTIAELYPIPHLQPSDVVIEGKPNFETPRPLPISANLAQENVKIQRVGGVGWILLNVAPGDVWPRVRHFLNENNLTLARADVAKGLLETHWMQFKTDPTSMDRYRIQIDQGVQPETTEVHIVHMSVPASQKNRDDLVWPQVSLNAEREKWLMDELAASLAADVNAAGTSMLAQAIGGDVKATLDTFKSEPILTIKLDRTRTLATLGYAAKQDGFVSFDSDATAGLFYVDYLNPEDAKPGFFARLFGAKENRVPTTKYTLEQIKPHLLTGDAFFNAPRSNLKADKALKGINGYVLAVVAEGSEHRVFIRDPYGKRIDPNTARELLIILRKNLI